jgi:hypothetical protein
MGRNIYNSVFEKLNGHLPEMGGGREPAKDRQGVGAPWWVGWTKARLITWRQKEQGCALFEI